MRHLCARLTSGNYRQLLFDWGGTVIASHESIVGAIVAAAHEICDVRLDHHLVASCIGLGLTDIFARLLGDKAAPALPALLATFSALYSEACARGDEPVIDGIPALLECVRQRGMGMSVALKKRALTLAASVRGTDLGRFFCHLLNAEYYPPKPDPAMCRFIEQHYGVVAADILMIGDSSVDRAFASNAGCEFLCLAPHAAGRDWPAKPTAVDIVAYMGSGRRQD